MNSSGLLSLRRSTGHHPWQVNSSSILSVRRSAGYHSHLEWSSQMSSSNVEVVSLLVMPLNKIRRRAKIITTSPNSDFAEGRTKPQKIKTLLLYSLTNFVPTKTIFLMVKIVLEFRMFR